MRSATEAAAAADRAPATGDRGGARDAARHRHLPVAVQPRGDDGGPDAVVEQDVPRIRRGAVAVRAVVARVHPLRRAYR